MQICVITSYSIHYTKLYELPLLLELELELLLESLLLKVLLLP